LKNAFHFKKIHQSALLWGILVVILKTGSAVFLLPLLLKRVPSAELGIWYVFLSIGGLAGLLDLGFGGCLVRSTGYLWAGAKNLLPVGHYSREVFDAEGPNLPMLAQLVGTMRFFYLMLASIILLLAGVVGTRFLWFRIGSVQHPREVWIAWMIFCAGLFMQTLGACWPSLLQGINQIRKSQQIQFIALICGYIVSVVGLLAGFGLIAVVCGQYLVYGVVVRILSRWLFYVEAGEEFCLQRQNLNLKILKTLWPMAWRSGVVGAGGYLIFSSSTLISAWYLSMEETACYGLTMQICNLLSSTAAFVFQVKMPLLNQLRILGDISRIQQIFITRIRWMICIYILGSIGVVSLAPQLLYWIGSHTQLVTSPLIIVILAMVFLEQFHVQHACLVFSENKNPFMWPALISGVAVVLFSCILTPCLHLWGMVLAQAGVQLAFNNWWTVLQGLKSIRLTFPQYFKRLLIP
jgi:O-antigen/teichoic acid export membrane protein